MDIHKYNYINSLLEFYKSLLTAKQSDYTELYYGDNFSLGEISEIKGVSRQAVYDNIKRTEKLLKEYENSLHLYSKFRETSIKISSLSKYVKLHYNYDTKLIKLVDDLENIE